MAGKSKCPDSTLGVFECSGVLVIWCSVVLVFSKVKGAAAPAVIEVMSIIWSGAAGIPALLS